MTTPFSILDSVKSPYFEELKRARTHSGREKSNLFLIEDEEMIEQALKASFKIQLIVFTEKYKGNLSYPGISCMKINQGMMGKIFSGGKTPEIIALAHQKKYLTENFSKYRFILVLDSIQNSNNLGMIFRIAEAFGIEGVIIIPHPSSDLYDRSVVPASGGSFFRIPIWEGKEDDVIAFLRKEGFTIMSTNPTTGVEISKQKLPLPLALMIGNESVGVSPKIESLSEFTVKIPMQGEIQSLNVAVATGILLYECRRLTSSLEK